MSDIEKELDTLAGENIALQAIVVGLCLGLQRIGMQATVEGAFAYADTIFEAGAIKIGNGPRPGHMRKAIEVTEALRVATLGYHGEPKHGV